MATYETQLPKRELFAPLALSRASTGGVAVIAFATGIWRRSS